MAPIDLTTVKKYNLDPYTGISVKKIYDGSTAEESKILEDDIICSINGKTIYRMNDLKSIMDTIKLGDKYMVNILRDGNIINIECIGKAVTVNEIKEIDNIAEEKYRKWVAKRYYKYLNNNYDE